jgi:hypothetical protein
MYMEKQGRLPTQAPDSHQAQEQESQLAGCHPDLQWQVHRSLSGQSNPAVYVSILYCICICTYIYMPAIICDGLLGVGWKSTLTEENRFPVEVIPHSHLRVWFFRRVQSKTWTCFKAPALEKEKKIFAKCVLLGRGDCDPSSPLVRQDSRPSLDRRVSFRHKCACAAIRPTGTADRWASQGGLTSYNSQPIERTIVRSYSIDKLR